MKRILLLEDDPLIGETIRRDLEEEGYRVTWVRTVAEARGRRACDFDLLLLDVTLPDGNSFDVCRRAREEAPAVPVLFITARTDEESAIRGLSLGAADYLRKPFGRRELLLRLSRFLKERSGTLEFGELVVRQDQHRVYRGEEELSLTPREYALLVALMRRGGEAVSREALVSALGDEVLIEDKTLNSYLSRLRTKLRGGARIEAVPGLGYRLEKAA